MGPFMACDSSLHSLLWRPWYKAQSKPFFTDLAAAVCLGCCWGGRGTWYLCGRQWHFGGTWLFVWPCVWCHTQTITAQLSVETRSFCVGCTEHQLFLLSVGTEIGRRSRKLPVFTWRFCDSFCLAHGTPDVSLIQDTTPFLEYSSVPVASESIGVAWLCTPWRAASQSFLWVGTIQHTILYSGLSTEITLPLLVFPGRFCSSWITSIQNNCSVLSGLWMV